MTTSIQPSSQDRNAAIAHNRTEEEILRAVRAVRFGSVEIVIHDAKVVQVERREKLRFSEEQPTIPMEAKPKSIRINAPNPTGSPAAPGHKESA